MVNQIQSDLAGKDFTVKAIALDLARDVYRGPSSFGEFAGRHDLRQSDALCGIGGTLDFVMEKAKDMNRLLYFVREQSFLTLEDRRRAWKNDGNPAKLQHFRSNNETKKKYKGQAQYRQKGFHQGPGFEGVGEAQLEVLLYQPEACVVYVR